MRTPEGLRLHVCIAHAAEAVADAAVVLLVYRADVAGDAAASVTEWRARVTCPAVLVGTHIDTRLREPPPWSDEQLDAMADPDEGAALRPLLDQWPGLAGAVEVALGPAFGAGGFNVSLALTVAVRAVYEPRHVLLGPEGAPTAALSRALRHLFYAHDPSATGRLTPAQLTALHRVLGGPEASAEDVAAAVARVTAHMRLQPGHWSGSGATYAGFEALALALAEHQPHTLWRALRYFHYDRALEVRPPQLARVRGGRTGLSGPALAWLGAVHARHARPSTGTLPLGHVRALLGLVPPPCPWPMEDVASGDAVALGEGGGLSLRAWQALWALLLLDSSEAAAREAERMARVWGYADEALVGGPECSITRVLVVGSGAAARARLVRGVVCGARLGADRPLAETRALCCAGSLGPTALVAADAPARVPAVLGGYDVALVPFDEDADARAWARATRAALACAHAGLPVVLVTLGSAVPERVQWAEQRGGRLYDVVADEPALRALLLEPARAPRLKLLPGDEAPRPPAAQQQQLQQQARARLADRALWAAASAALVAAGSWLGRALAPWGVPPSLATTVCSLLAAWLAYEHVLRNM